MSNNTTQTDDVTKKSLLKKLQIQDSKMLLYTILTSLLGVAFYLLLALFPMPYLVIDLFKFGLLPALAIISVTGAIRGPLAGFLTGYLGVLVYDYLFYGAVVTLTLPAAAYGVLGFVAGLGTYDFTDGRSLAKLSILSMVGMVFTALLITVIGLTVEVYATLAAIGFVMLPLITLGLPSVILLTPLLARAWHLFMSKVYPKGLPK